MAPLQSLRVIQFTSQDPNHGVKNVLDPYNTKKWLCAKDAVGENLELEIELESSTRIEHINLGNFGSAFIEVMVGKSAWSTQKRYEVLLPSVTLMSPSECKQWVNLSQVFMFSTACFQSHIAAQKWDKLKIRCQQPFAKDRQFGLKFLELRAPDNKEQHLMGEVEDGQFFNDSEKNVLKKDVYKAISSSGAHIPPKNTLLSRSAKCVQNALSKNSKKRASSSIRWPSNSGEISHSQADDHVFNVKASEQQERSLKNNEETPTHQKLKFPLARELRFANNNIVSTRFPTAVLFNVQRTPRRRKTRFQDEAKCFLEGAEINRNKVENILFSELKEKMEKLRGSRLNKEERKLFHELIVNMRKKERIQKVTTTAVRVTEKIDLQNYTEKTDSNKDLPKKSFINQRKTVTDNHPNASVTKRRDVLTSRNVIWYDNDIKGPPKKAKAIAPLISDDIEDTKTVVTPTATKYACSHCGDTFSTTLYKIHAPYCQGKSLLAKTPGKTKTTSKLLNYYNNEAINIDSSDESDHEQESVLVQPKHEVTPREHNSSCSPTYGKDSGNYAAKPFSVLRPCNVMSVAPSKHAQKMDKQSLYVINDSTRLNTDNKDSSTFQSKKLNLLSIVNDPRSLSTTATACLPTISGNIKSSNNNSILEINQAMCPICCESFPIHIINNHANFCMDLRS